MVRFYENTRSGALKAIVWLAASVENILPGIERTGARLSRVKTALLEGLRQLRDDLDTQPFTLALFQDRRGMIGKG